MYSNVSNALSIRGFYKEIFLDWGACLYFLGVVKSNARALNYILWCYVSFLPCSKFTIPFNMLRTDCRMSLEPMRFNS